MLVEHKASPWSLFQTCTLASHPGKPCLTVLLCTIKFRCVETCLPFMPTRDGRTHAIIKLPGLQSHVHGLGMFVIITSNFIGSMGGCSSWSGSGSLLQFLHWGCMLWRSNFLCRLPRTADVTALLQAVQTHLASVEDPLILLERVSEEHCTKDGHSLVLRVVV